MGGGPRANDNNPGMHSSGSDLGDLGRLFGVLLETGGGGGEGGEGEAAGDAGAEKSSSESRGKQLGGILTVRDWILLFQGERDFLSVGCSSCRLTWRGNSRERGFQERRREGVGR